DAEEAIPKTAHRAWQLYGIEVFLDEWLVGNEEPVLQGEVHRRWCLAAPRRGDQDHIGLAESAHALTVVVLNGVLNGGHSGVVSLDVPDTVATGCDSASRNAQARLD